MVFFWRRYVSEPEELEPPLLQKTASGIEASAKLQLGSGRRSLVRGTSQTGSGKVGGGSAARRSFFGGTILEDVPKIPSLRDYNITVVTSDLYGAATASNVFVELKGSLVCPT